MLYSIILPTYNERENLPLIFYLIYKVFEEEEQKRVKKDSDSASTSASTNDTNELKNQDEQNKFEVVVVDDSSPDGTLEVAKQLQSIYGKELIQIVSREGKLGLGSAYLAGLKKANGERIILMDADLSHHPKFIPQMISVMNKNEVNLVCGTRYKKGGGVAGWDIKRKVTSRGANVLASILLNPGPSDLTGSFRLYDRMALESILPNVRAKGYAFQMEILVLAKSKGLTFAEVPITFVDRLYGESKLGANEIILYLKGLFYLFFTT